MKTFDEYITEGLKITLGPAKFEQETADKEEEAWHGLGKHKGKFSIFVDHKKKTVQIANWGASGGAKDAVEIGKAVKKEWKGYKVLKERD